MGILVNQNQIGGGGRPSNTSRNIGDIFYTTRTDNSLNGAVECNGSQYNFADINGGDNNIQALLEAGKLPYVYIGEFDSMVSEKGWCDKIGYKNNIILYPVWEFMRTPEDRYNGDYYTNIYWGDAEVGEDGVLQGVKLYEKDTYNELVGWYVKRNVRYDYIYDENNEIVFSDYGWLSYNGKYAISVGETETTYFKVPKLSAYIIQKENIPVIGNGMTLGLTDGTNTVGIKYYGNNYCVAPFTSASAGGNVGDNATGVSSPLKNEKLIGLTTVGTKSGIIADTSDVATTERVMIQLFNGSTDTALATCTEVLSDVAGLKQTTDGMIDYVIESQAPSESNGYTWYRLYKSGWVEQGKFSNRMGSGVNTTCMLIIPMKDTNYFITGVYDTNTKAVNSLARIGVGTKRTQSFQMYTEGGEYSWEVKGFSNITN